MAPMTILSAMSGGVDSAVATHLLQQDGHTVLGGTLFLRDGGEEECRDARVLADRLGIPHHIFDLRNEFSSLVIGPFIEAYEQGKTPNPCVLCNRTVKFGLLLDRARALGCDAIATGHYVRREVSPSGRVLLRRAADAHKDQSYVLYSLSQEQLTHAHFPLGELTKTEVREIAEAEGFLNARKRDSQDICFIPDGDYGGFLERAHGGPYPAGEFRTLDGTVKGTHRGLVHYTIGQRKGLGLALPAPLYVCAKNTADNSVILSDNDALFSNTLTARQINFLPFDCLDRPMRLLAKVRYAQTAQPATVEQIEDDRLRVTFDHPQRAIAHGQAVVFYADDYLIGGGTIE
ncbi:MAG: tRNA 2-thiouridine(34) synthase MnmA [Clostridia bacterium]|nr:tRNA 2-thiouridine(34) synthase MnmA [Clostridia bacterium]